MAVRGLAGLLRRRKMKAGRLCRRIVALVEYVIVVAVRWYLRYGLSYRDIEEELLAGRGIEVDQVGIYRWMQRFTRC